VNHHAGPAYTPAVAGTPATAGAGTVAATPAPAPGLPVEALRQQAAAVLQHSYRWLESAVPLAPQTADLVPALSVAVQLYEAAQYEASLALAQAVAQGAWQIRQAVPALPPW